MKQKKTVIARYNDSVKMDQVLKAKPTYVKALVGDASGLRPLKPAEPGKNNRNQANLRPTGFGW